MNKKQIKQLFLLVAMIFVFAILLITNRELPYADSIKEILTSYGLENTKIKHQKDNYENHYTFVHRGDDSVTYHELFCLMKDVNSISTFVVLDKFVAGKDTYTINKEAGQVYLNGVHVYTDHEYLAEKKRLEEERAKKEEERKNQYSDRYPFVGMREEFLCNTILGEPDSIEDCRDFYKLQTRRQYRTYTWNNTQWGKYEVTVRFRQHRSRNVDDYIDLPTSNGYVDCIGYFWDGDYIHQDYGDTYR